MRKNQTILLSQVQNISVQSPNLNPAIGPEKPRFSSNQKNLQSKEASDYILGSRQPLNSPDQRKQGIKPDPASKVGVSYEAPDFFFGSNTILASNHAYNNVYMTKADKREARYKQMDSKNKKNLTSLKNSDEVDGRTIHNYQTYNIKDNFKDHTINSSEIFNIKKANKHRQYNCLTHQNSVIKTPDLKLNEIQQYNEGYYKVLEKQGSFRRQKEYFLDFVEQNDSMHVYGHINQKERPTKFRQVKVYHLSQEEQKRRDKVKNSMKRFLNNLSMKFQGKKSKTMEESKNLSTMSLSKKLVGMFSASPLGGGVQASGSSHQESDFVKESPSPENQLTDRDVEQPQQDTNSMGGFKFLKRSQSQKYQDGASPRKKVTSGKFFQLGTKIHNEKSLLRSGSNESVYSNLSNTVRNHQVSQSQNSSLSQFGTNYGSFKIQQNHNNSNNSNYMDIESPHYSTQINYHKKQNDHDDYKKIPIYKPSSLENNLGNPPTVRDRQSTHLYSLKSKTYSNFYPTLGGVSKLPKDKPMKCLQPERNTRYNGDKYLQGKNSQYRRQFNKTIEKDILKETLSHTIFKKPLVYITRKPQKPTKELKTNNVEQLIDSFEKTLDLHNQANSTYSQGFIWFNNMAKESNLIKEQ